MTYSLAARAGPLLGCAFTESPHHMITARLTIARSASGAAWSLAHGFGGVAGKRLAANRPAPI